MRRFIISLVGACKRINTIFRNAHDCRRRRTRIIAYYNNITRYRDKDNDDDDDDNNVL